MKLHAVLYTRGKIHLYWYQRHEKRHSLLCLVALTHQRNRTNSSLAHLDSHRSRETPRAVFSVPTKTRSGALFFCIPSFLLFPVAAFPLAFAQTQPNTASTNPESPRDRFTTCRIHAPRPGWTEASDSTDEVQSRTRSITKRRHQHQHELFLSSTLLRTNSEGVAAISQVYIHKNRRTRRRRDGRRVLPPNSLTKLFRAACREEKKRKKTLEALAYLVLQFNPVSLK